MQNEDNFECERQAMKIKQTVSKMLASGSSAGVVLMACWLLLPLRATAAAGWIQASPTGTAPDSIGTMLLLPDGTVMVKEGNTTANWFRLTPGSTGGYTNGAWSTRASMHTTRQYFSSDVLQDGRVFVCGGEYGTGTTNAEIYNPTSDSWTVIPIPAQLIQTDNTIDSQGGNTAGFSDSLSVVLSTGNVLIFPVYPYYINQTIIYNPTSNTWSSVYLVNNIPNDDEDEADLVKLPDDSILVIDTAVGDQSINTSERFIPSLNQWVADANVPTQLYDPYGDELGAGFLLPNGKALFVGSTPHTLLYTPSGNTNKGTWAKGPDIPTTPGTLGQPDAPGAMMVNGNVLCALSPTPSSGANIFTTPTYFYEYDYNSGSIGAWVQDAVPGGGSSFNNPTFIDRMLDLPDGTVLFGDRSSSTLYVYNPASTPLAAGKPTINTVSYNADGSLHLTGTLFNGISQGADYGDDAQMDSNYPLVQFTSGGTVYYGRTFNWSGTSVMTGSQVVSTECALPPNLPSGNCSMVVIANGIASSSVTFGGPVWVDFNYSGPQTGTYANPWETLASGVSHVASGGTILINASVQPSQSAETMTISTPMTILSVSGASTIGN